MGVDRKFRVWVDRPTEFSTRRAARIHHNFHEHPLMQLPALAGLAKELVPTKQCRFIQPGCTLDAPFRHEAESPDGRAIDEVFQRIEEPGSWVALYAVESVPRYRDFLREVTDNVRDLVDGEQPGMFNVGGYIFISAPPSVTPFHIDRENNFWLQIRGRKKLNVWDFRDRSVVAAPDVETFITNGGLANVRLTPDKQALCQEFDTGPGDGVYFPSTSPHATRSETDWVTPGNGVSISIGVVFYTEVTRREANAHVVNRVLRQLGMSPRFPGESALVDGIKFPLGRAIVWLQKTLRGYKPRVGM